MGGGGEPLGFREEDGLSSPNFHVPGIGESILLQCFCNVLPIF